MSLATGLVNLGRNSAQALMESTCVITRASAGSPSVDHSTGLANVITTTIYSGPCRLSYKIDRPTQEVAEGQSIAHAKAVLSLPVIGSADVRADDLVTVTMSAALDPGTVVSGRIEAPFAQTHATARRFPFEVLS